jgi:hypothetical protein
MDDILLDQWGTLADAIGKGLAKPYFAHIT